MIIEFDNPKHGELVENYELLSKKYNRVDEDFATQILATIEVLKAADSLFDLPKGYRPHPLKGKAAGYFAVDVTNKHRVIFKPNHSNDPNFRIDNPKSINSILISEIFMDYHT